MNRSNSSDVRRPAGSLTCSLIRARLSLLFVVRQVLDAADSIDRVGAKAARAKISVAKVYTPRAVLAIIDRVIQVHGGMGVSDKVPLAVGTDLDRRALGPDSHPRFHAHSRRARSTGVVRKRQDVEAG